MTLNIIIHNIFVIIFFVRPNIFFSTTFMHIKGVQLEWKGLKAFRCLFFFVTETVSIIKTT